MRDEELGIRNEELMLLPRWGEFMLWVLMPRALPSADGVCTFRAQYGAWSGDSMNTYRSDLGTL